MGLSYSFSQSWHKHLYSIESLILVFFLESILELEVGVVGPLYLLSRETFSLVEVKLDLLAEMRFVFMKIVEAR
jgi:hypothetical protein